MTTTQMRYFLETARQLSFTLAADRLYITQPTLSRHIMSMEQELGVQLFVRSNNTVWLTSAGRELYYGLSKLCEDYDLICSRVENADRGIAGELRIALLDDQLINPSLSNIISHFQKEYPQVKLIFTRTDFKGLHAGLLTGEIDLAVSFQHNEDFDNRIGMLLVENEPMFLAVPTKYNISEDTILSISTMPEKIKKIPFLMLALECFEQNAVLPPSSWLNIFIDECASIGGKMAIDTVAALPIYVAMGFGMAMVNKTNILSIHPEVTKVTIENSPHIKKVICFNKRVDNIIVNNFLRVYKETYGDSCLLDYSQLSQDKFTNYLDYDLSLTPRREGDL